MTNPIHFPILQAIGLNENEALVYQLLLESGPKPAQNLIEPSKLGRGNLYNTLNALKEKGLIMEESGTKKIYQAVDPENLRKLAKTQVISAQETLNQLESTLPALKSTFRLITKKPTFRIFEGIDGMKEIYKEILETGQPIYSLVGTDTPAPELIKWLRGTYVQKRIASNLHVYTAISGGKRADSLEESAEQELRTVVDLPEDQFPFEGEVTVFGNSIAFMNYKETELIGLILESPALATTLRSSVKALLAFAPKN